MLCGYLAANLNETFNPSPVLSGAAHHCASKTGSCKRRYFFD
jgi:hypothetical protein